MYSIIDFILPLIGVLTGAFILKKSLDSTRKDKYSKKQLELAVESKEYEEKIRKGVEDAKRKLERYNNLKKKFEGRVNATRSSNDNNDSNGPSN